MAENYCNPNGGNLYAGAKCCQSAILVNEADWPLVWRPWQAGDRIVLKGGGHQLVRRLLIDRKVPAERREQVQVLVNAQGNVLWVVGHKFSYRTTGTQTVFLALKHES